MDYFVHITTQAEWEAAQRAGEYRAPSLEREGFIHLSRPEQVLAVANRFYRGLEGAVLLWIEPQKLQGEIRWESADEELFPHLYASLNLDAVPAVTPLIPAEDGSYQSLSGPG